MNEGPLANVGIRLPAYASGSVQMAGGPREVLDYAARVEDLGFDSLWVIDHLLVAPALYATSWFDPLDLLSAVGARTRHIKLGTAILVVPLWNPVMLARRIATLCYLNPDRFILGVGPGWDAAEFNAVGVDRRERGSRTDESLELMKRLWTGEETTFEGKHFSVEGIRVEPSLASSPPIWVAGGSLTRAKNTGDVPTMAATVRNRVISHQGWIARSGGSDLDDVRRDWETIRAAATAEAAEVPVFAHAQFVHIVDSDDEERVLNEQLEAFRRVMGKTRTIDDLKASYLIGTIDTIQARITELRDVGLDYLIVNPVLPDPEQLDLIVRHIAPVMKS